MKKITTLISLICLVSVCQATEPTFHKVNVAQGDGILTLLKRYELTDRVSTEKFCDLNQLEPTSPLRIDREYALPILVFQFDGKSIRSTIGINDWDMAVRISDYNKLLVSRGILEGVYKETGVLWVPYKEIAGAGSMIAASTAKTPALRQPLFGTEYQDITPVSQKLQGQVFYIVSGHGGPDPGAIGETWGHTLCEDEYAYDVSLRLARNLMEHGAIVELIVQDPNDGIRSGKYLDCDKDEVTADKREMPINQRLRLQQRTHLVNKLHKQYKSQGIHEQTVVCIHVDSRSPRSRQDVFFYYCEGSKTGQRIAQTLQDTFDEKYREKRAGRGYSGTVTSRGLYELRHTDPPAVYIELANIQNAADLKRILPESNRQAVANWLCDGLLNARG